MCQGQLCVGSNPHVRVFVECMFGLAFVCSGLRCGGGRVFGCVPVFAVFGGSFAVVFGSVRLPLLILYCVRLNACSRVRGRAKIHIHIYIDMCIYIYTHTYIYIYIYICMYVYMYVCMYDSSKPAPGGTRRADPCAPGVRERYVHILGFRV